MYFFSLLAIVRYAFEIDFSQFKSYIKIGITVIPILTNSLNEFSYI